MKRLTKLMSVILAAAIMMTVLCVSAGAASAPKLSKTSLTLNVGDSYQLYVNNVTRSISWSTTNSKVAAVSYGKVTAKKAGSAVIKVTHGSTTLKCSVTVKGSTKVSVPSGSVSGTYNGHTYAVIKTETDPVTANNNCKKLGGHLATITSQGEQDFLAKLAAKVDYANFWIGGTDKGSEGKWYWVTGEKWSYTAWYPGGNVGTAEPNNGLGYGEDYVFMNRDRGYKWVDGYGGYSTPSFYYICEWDGSAAVSVSYDGKGFDSAIQIDIGKSYSNESIMKKNQEIVYYKFTTGSARNYTITMKHPKDYFGSADAIFKLYDSSKNAISSDVWFKDSVTKTYSLKGNSVYYIQTWDYVVLSVK